LICTAGRARSDAPDRFAVSALLARGMAVAALLIAAVGCTPKALAPGFSGRPSPEAFDVYGRVAVRHDGDGSSGAVRWQRVGARDAVDLYGPTGSVVAKLRRAPGRATLDTSDGRHHEAVDARALSQDVLGWELPLEPLRFWVFGQPAPSLGAAEVEAGADGRPAQLRQGEWTVRWRDWRTVGGQAAGDAAAIGVVEAVPARIDLERPGLAVKLVMSRWSDPGPSQP
jgi:outer membrane lipoprotein LolB